VSSHEYAACAAQSANHRPMPHCPALKVEFRLCQKDANFRKLPPLALRKLVARLDVTQVLRESWLQQAKAFGAGAFCSHFRWTEDSRTAASPCTASDCSRPALLATV
jgi:hypothetical protein